MSSASLDRWRSERAELLDQLIAAHASIGGTGPGRRRSTSELNRALVGRLAAQFQGFAKDLHQEAALRFGELSHPTEPRIAQVIATGLQANRELDRGNAQKDSLASDFGRFGLRFWTQMDQHDVRTATRKERLDFFNRARNALAHDDEVKLARLQEAGYLMNLATIRQWRSSLDGLAGSMDRVLAVHLASLFNVREPW